MFKEIERRSKSVKKNKVDFDDEDLLRDSDDGAGIALKVQKK